MSITRSARFIEFIRFEEKDGMLGSVIHPKNNVLPLLRGHFCSRLPDEDFLIFDAAHGTALLRQSGHVQYLAMERYEPAPTMPTSLNWQAAVETVLPRPDDRGAPQRQSADEPRAQALLGPASVEMREPYI